MLSILIPTYNYDIFALAANVNRQCVLLQIDFEVIVIDDASGGFVSENSRINSLNNCSYSILPENVGRSKIRNLLASRAKYDWLLFLDADVLPVRDSFIANYLEHTNKLQAVNGGILYTNKKPDDNKMLRWTYGKSREALPANARSKNPYLAFLSLNFLIPKALFEQVKFDESLPNLRHEDTVFSYRLQQKNITVLHIDNPVYHLGLDTFDIMLNKEHESLQALKLLVESGKISPEYVKMGRYYAFLKKTSLAFFVSAFFELTRKSLLSDISKPNPSLFWYDVYRLGYLCSLKS
ncbi:MAG: glycosyltransferase [Flavobacterium sp.]|uniref:glycosyltransferase family 2 protein n=1 Tax=Flavobacterium sp. TaxID=239 RepID=UPI0011FE1AB2|nr:glycosyltransferase family 2 protein [Flavobacterium sp.]RZJ65105.1 MAG: glycosyltransferase [Flavobacterium sp.]